LYPPSFDGEGITVEADESSSSRRGPRDADNFYFQPSHFLDTREIVEIAKAADEPRL